MLTSRETSCGLGSWRPAWLQRLATKQVYVLLYAVLGAVQGMGHTYLSSVLSSIEKQFGIKSEEAAWIFSGNEISQIFFIFFFPFLSSIKRRSLWTSVSMLASGLGILLCAIPYLAADKGQYEGTFGIGTAEGSSSQLCGAKSPAGECLAGRRDWAGMVAIFTGFFITGIGTSFFYSFGIPYIDDNVSKNNSPLVLSLIMVGRVMGPSLGYLLGGFCLSTYVSPGLESPGLSEGDPGWLGAWWLGFIIISAATVAVAPFLALFPQALPSSEDTDQKKMDKQNEEKSDSPKTGKELFQDTLDCSKRLIRNKVYVFNSFSTIFLLFGIIGFATFVPKYFEYHFRMNASTSGKSGGLSKAVATVVGLLLSGIVITKFKFTGRTLAGYSVFVSLATTACFFSAVYITCPKLTVVEPPASCVSACFCDASVFQPTCSMDGTSLYFSPCHAGCTQSRQEPGARGRPQTVYTSCSCLAPSNTTVAPWWNQEEDQELPPPSVSQGVVPVTEAAAGHCPSDCSSSFTMMIGVLMVASLLASTGRLGNQLVGLRAVEPRDKAASMLVMVAVLSMLVFLPSPLVFGRLMDNACVVWGSECGTRTNCVLYDTDLMRTSTFYMVSGFMLLATFCDFGVWLYAGHVKVFDSDEEVLEAKKKEGHTELGKVA